MCLLWGLMQTRQGKHWTQCLKDGTDGDRIDKIGKLPPKSLRFNPGSRYGLCLPDKRTCRGNEKPSDTFGGNGAVFNRYAAYYGLLSIQKSLWRGAGKVEQGNGKWGKGSGKADGKHQGSGSHLPCLFQGSGKFKHGKLYLWPDRSGSRGKGVVCFPPFL